MGIPGPVLAPGRYDGEKLWVYQNQLATKVQFILSINIKFRVFSWKAEEEEEEVLTNLL